MKVCRENPDLVQIGQKYRIFSNLIRTSFCRFLKQKKMLVRGSNPQLLRKSSGGCRLHGKPSWRALSSDLSRSVAISNALDGSEDDILWEDDGEDKGDSDWVT